VNQVSVKLLSFVRFVSDQWILEKQYL